jgi:hypothetical protein
MVIPQHHRRVDRAQRFNDAARLVSATRFDERAPARTTPQRPQRLTHNDPTDRARTCTKVRIQARYTHGVARAGPSEGFLRHRLLARSNALANGRAGRQAPALLASRSTTRPGLRSASSAARRRRACASASSSPPRWSEPAAVTGWTAIR